MNSGDVADRDYAGYKFVKTATVLIFVATVVLAVLGVAGRFKLSGRSSTKDLCAERDADGSCTRCVDHAALIHGQCHGNTM